MEITKKESFVKQITLYIRNREGQKAYDLALDFAGRFPQEMVSHFLLAKTSFDLGRFEEARAEGVKAFNLSHAYNDMLASALLASTAYLELKDYSNGFHLLKEMEKKGASEELELALLAFSLALENEKEALSHITKLYALNEKLAMELAQRMISA